MKNKKPSKRRLAREACFTILYQIAIRDEAIKQVMKEYWVSVPQVEQSIMDFAEDLVVGISEIQDELNEIIIKRLENWEFDRVALIDKIILRMGVFEIIYRDDIPDNVAINEAIEIAKKFSDGPSSKFVNGILDKVAKNKKK